MAMGWACCLGLGFERLLRSWGMEQILFTGVSTNSCVEGTARDAADRGYRCLLVEDGCGAASQRLHDASCENFQRLLGRVAPSAARFTPEKQWGRSITR